MKAMVLHGPCQLALDEVAIPTRRPDEVLIRVNASGVCGTDLKIFNGSIPVAYPRIMGHELAGEVVEGGGQHGPGPGQRVIIDPILHCGLCFQCRAGQTSLCANGGLLGRETNGGFAEYICVPAKYAFRLPDSVDIHTAPVIQVLTTCLHAQRLTNIFVGEAVVVLGLGVSGQLHIQLAKARGANPVIGITRGAAKRELAEKLGADLTLAPDNETAQKIRDATHGHGADVVIETTGTLPSLTRAINVARSGARLLLFGIITATEGALPFYQLYFKELTLIGARAGKSEDYPSAIELVDKGIIRLEPIVSRVMPLAQLQAVMSMLASDGAQTLKVILDHR